MFTLRSNAVDKSASRAGRLISATKPPGIHGKRSLGGPQTVRTHWGKDKFHAHVIKGTTMSRTSSP